MLPNSFLYPALKQLHDVCSIETLSVLQESPASCPSNSEHIDPSQARLSTPTSGSARLLANFRVAYARWAVALLFCHHVDSQERASEVYRL